MQLSNFFRYRLSSFICLLTTAALSGSASAGWPFSSSASTQPSTQDIETVKSVLMENPSIVFDALVLYQKEQEVAREQAVQDYLKTNAQKLFLSETDGVLGNPEGKTNILFINDYRCGYCGKVRTALDQVIEENNNVRVSVKQLPILGPDSLYAAKAATFAQQKNKFSSFDVKLKAQEKPITIEKVNTALEQAGLASADLADQLESLQKIITENYTQAQNLNIKGTPAVLITNSELQKFEFISNPFDAKMISEKIKEY